MSRDTREHCGPELVSYRGLKNGDVVNYSKDGDNYYKGRVTKIGRGLFVVRHTLDGYKNIDVIDITKLLFVCRVRSSEL